jgi:SsrA-binding protein
MIHKNKKAYFDFFIEEEIEAGICLLGSEVKSIREGRVSLRDSYVSQKGEEFFIFNSHIGEYKGANRFNHEPRRLRKTLLHKRQINKLAGKIKQKGYSLIPLEIYSNDRGFIKVKIGLAKGKKLYDKRATLKEKDIKRSLQREMES